MLNFLKEKKRTEPKKAPEPEEPKAKEGEKPTKKKAGKHLPWMHYEGPVANHPLCGRMMLGGEKITQMPSKMSMATPSLNQKGFDPCPECWRMMVKQNLFGGVGMRSEQVAGEREMVIYPRGALRIHAAGGQVFSFDQAVLRTCEVEQSGSRAVRIKLEFMAVISGGDKT